MSVELNMLVWSVLLGIAYLVAAALGSVAERGLPWAAGARDETPPLKGKVGGRLDRAWRNFLETFPLFAALVLTVVASGHANANTALAAQLYFWGRLAYLPLYALGIPWLRTLSWAVSIAGILMLAFALL